MGYCMDQKHSAFKIKKENFAAALEAIKGLALQASQIGGGSSRGEKGFSWVSTEEFTTAGTLKEALSAWRWETNESKEGDIDGIFFNGEKLGDDQTLFETLAPYVEAGSFIGMEGEDGAIWRWFFDGKNCFEESAEVDYDNHKGMIKSILEHKELLPQLIGLHPNLDKKIQEALE